MNERCSVSTPDRVTPATRRKLLLLITLLIGAFVSLGCGTWSLVTEVGRTEAGKHQVSLHMGLEIDKQVFRALQDMEAGNSQPVFSDLQRQGWAVTSLEGGRVVTATKALTPLGSACRSPWNL